MDALYDLPFTRAAAPALRRRAHPRVRDGEALDRHDARLLRRLHLLQHHRARGAHHPEPLARRACSARCARSRAWTTSRGVITDLGGPTANMYKMTLQGRAHRERVPAPLVRASRRSARTSSPITTPLHRAHAHGAQGDGHQARLHRLRRPLRPRRAQPRVHPRARRSTTPAASSRSRPSTTTRDVLDKMKKPGIESYERFAQAFCQASEKRRQGAVPRPVLHHRPPRLDAEGHDRARALPEEERTCARARCRTSSRRRWRWRRRCTTRASIRSRASPSTPRATCARSA